MSNLLLTAIQIRPSVCFPANLFFPKVYEAITSHENSVSCADDKLSTFAKKPVLVSRRAEKGLTRATFSPLSKCVTAEI